MTALAEHGVLVMPLSPTHLRFVAHLDVGEADLERLVTACAAILGDGRSSMQCSPCSEPGDGVVQIRGGDR